MTEPNESITETAETGLLTIADAAVRLSVSIPRLRRLLARPEWAGYLRQIQRETKTGMRASTVLPEDLLPQLQDAFSREQQQQIIRSETPVSRDTGLNEMVLAPAATTSNLSPLVDALLREKDSRIAELQRHIEDLLIDKEQLYRALTRAQVANVLPPPEQRKELPAPDASLYIEESREDTEMVADPEPLPEPSTAPPSEEVLSPNWEPQIDLPKTSEAPAVIAEEGGQKQSFWARFRAAHPRLTEHPPITPPAETKEPESKEEPLAMTPESVNSREETPEPEPQEMPLFAFSNPTEVKMPRWLEEELAEKQREEGLKTPATWNTMTLMTPEEVAAAQRAVYAEPEPFSLTAHREETPPAANARKRGTWDKLSDWIKD